MRNDESLKKKPCKTFSLAKKKKIPLWKRSNTHVVEWLVNMWMSDFVIDGPPENKKQTLFRFKKETRTITSCYQ